MNKISENNDILYDCSKSINYYFYHFVKMYQFNTAEKR